MSIARTIIDGFCGGVIILILFFTGCVFTLLAASIAVFWIISILVWAIVISSIAWLVWVLDRKPVKKQKKAKKE